jgi:pre-mRNA-splicing factor 38B
VQHLEPWEKGSRKTTGLTGMCGGVRGVGGGGIVSSCFCLLYKLFTLKLTRKQLVGLMNHADSPYIRALGFMYVRYTQAPQDLFTWFADYLDDEEELDVRAGGGMSMRVGQMLRHWLIRLEWFDTLFPRIPVPIQADIMCELRGMYGPRVDSAAFVDIFSTYVVVVTSFFLFCNFFYIIWPERNRRVSRHTSELFLSKIGSHRFARKLFPKKNHESIVFRNTIKVHCNTQIEPETPKKNLFVLIINILSSKSCIFRQKHTKMVF